MNKKVIGLLLAIPTLMGFGLTSCSEEESIATKDTVQEKVVNVTLTASLSDLTRTSFDPEKAILKFKWILDDQIKVVNAETGKYMGTLEVSKVQEDPRLCEFKGSIVVPSDENTADNLKLNFYYLGTEGKPAFKADLTLEDYSVDFSSQNGAAEFAKNDILIGKGEFSRKNVESGNIGIINFNRDFAYARFILKHNGEEIDLNGKTVTISANTGTLYNKATLNFQNATYENAEGTIAVSPTTNDFYVSFPATEAVNLKFTVDMGDGNVFEGTKGKELIKNIYYTADTEGSPIIVEMKNIDGSDDLKYFRIIYYQNLWDKKSVYEQDKRPSTAIEEIFDIKDFADVFPNNTLDSKYYEFRKWASAENGAQPFYSKGDKVTLSINDIIPAPQTVDGKEVKVYTLRLYADWMFCYIFKYDLDGGVVNDNGTVSATLEDAENYSNVKNNVKVLILDVDNGVSLSKDGYEFLGWKEKKADDTLGELITDNYWMFDCEHPEVTLVAVWEKKPFTAGSGDFTPVDITKKSN